MSNSDLQMDQWYSVGGDIPARRVGNYISFDFHDNAITWKHFPRFLALCEENPPVIGGFPLTKASGAELWRFFYLRVNK